MGWLAGGRFESPCLPTPPSPQETASSIRGIKLWTTNEYRHSGIRDDGSRIFERLLGMARNVIFD